MFQSMKNFKTRYVLEIKYISTSKEILKLLLNFPIVLSSNRVEPTILKTTIVNYF